VVGASTAAFFPLYFLSQGWANAGLGLSFFGVAFVAMRLLCGHLPDRIGGRNVAALSLVLEACGQFLIWFAPGPYTAFAGAFLTGAGCSMAFPAMGAEVVKRVPAHLRGTPSVDLPHSRTSHMGTPVHLSEHWLITSDIRWPSWSAELPRASAYGWHTLPRFRDAAQGRLLVPP
jgi:MFS family permease